jgi:proteic killer suppression protein
MVLLGNMKIYFRTKRLQAALADSASRTKAYGADMAKKIGVRLTTLQAADSLYDLWPPMKLPERCHELKGDLAGTFSIDLKHPFRLLFVPFELPILPDEDPKTLWKACTAIEIADLADTHG